MSQVKKQTKWMVAEQPQTSNAILHLQAEADQSSPTLPAVLHGSLSPLLPTFQIQRKDQAARPRKRKFAKTQASPQLNLGSRVNELEKDFNLQAQSGVMDKRSAGMTTAPMGLMTTMTATTAPLPVNQVTINEIESAVPIQPEVVHQMEMKQSQFWSKSIALNEVLQIANCSYDSLISNSFSQFYPFLTDYSNPNSVEIAFQETQSFKLHNLSQALLDFIIKNRFQNLLQCKLTSTATEYYSIPEVHLLILETLQECNFK